MLNHASSGFEASDDALLLRVGQGDGQAFRQLYDHLAPSLYALALRMLQDEATAQNVLEEVFLTVWNKASSYHPEAGPALVWIVRELRIRALDILRTNQLQPQEATEQKPSATKPGMEARSEKIKLALAHLIDFQREAVLLAYFDGLTLQGLSDYLEEPLGAVQNRAYKGMARLREALRSYHA